MRTPFPPRRLPLVCIALTAALLGCGGAGAPVAPVVNAPMEQLPVLSQLIVTLPADTLRASETSAASVVARDTRSRDMTVGFVAWRSSNPAVLAVGTDGSIAALAPGAAIVSARVGDVEGVRTVTVLPPPPGPLPVAVLELSPFITDLAVGRTLLLTAVPRDYAGTPITDRGITFATNDSAIAIVAGDGTVTARSTGIALIDVTCGGKRAAAYIRVRAPIDRNVVVSVAEPLDGTILSDTVAVTATVRSARPLVSVTASISGGLIPMRRELIQKFDVTQEIWVVTLDVSTLPFGPLALVVTATDGSGAEGVTVVPLIRNPKVAGGGGGAGPAK